ncbi:VPLPA-CTERM sorting domain-containing protein [Roseobacter sp. MH60115]|uniref:VPLPA-CTERM sorting domain-containing protein n=1 Tax=Roseobacter sp. MH60115 TaxID=2785324 RepID=UPI0018A29BA5|nr:VPLPA-CTERM sorting domain-containing protein [Roseobacter sp. MH60115]
MTKSFQTIVSAALLSALSYGAHAATLNTADFGISYQVVASPISKSESFAPRTGFSEGVSFTTPGNTSFADVEGDLATGRLRARSGRADLGSFSAQSTRTLAVIKDTISVDASALSFNDIFSVTFTTRLSGSLAAGGRASYSLLADRVGSSDLARFTGNWFRRPATTTDFVDYRDPLVDFGGSFTKASFDAGEGLVSVSFNLRGDRIYDFGLTATLITEGDADFFNTAALGIDTSVPWTSASGIFLSDTGVETSPVPLPAAAWFLLAGLGALRLLRRNAGMA